MLYKLSTYKKTYTEEDIYNIEKQLKNNIYYKKLNIYKNDVSKVVNLILS